MKINELIEQSTRIGKGVERSCYVHPSFPGKVFKVSDEADSKQTLREIKYFSYLKKKRVPFTHIPDFVGSFRESRKVVIEQELVRNDDGTEGRTLADFLLEAKNQEELKNRYQQAIGIVKAVENYLLKFNIMTCDMNPYNIVLVKHDGKDCFYLVDGLGTTDLLPVSKFVPFFGRKKIERHIEKLRKKVDMYYQRALDGLNLPNK